jgi:hypothetical protein
MRLNLSQHTLPSDKLALSDQISEAVDALKAKLCAEHQPANQTEEILVEELAEQFWRLRRARAMESSLLDSDKVLIPHLAAIQRIMSSAERGFHKALRVLRQLQKDRGFVPQKEQPVGQTVLPSADSDQNPDCQGGVKLTAERCELIAPSGFVPPPCPKDEDIDPADWARAFEARNRIWKKQKAA